MAQLSRFGTWYLFDYGMVISTVPEPEDWAALERETGLDLQSAGSPYWSHREDFDAGRVTPAAYWSGVLGRPVGENQVRVFEELDAAQWAHLNPATLAVLVTLSQEAAGLALLSNMPAGIFNHVLTDLDVKPKRIVFIDDNEQNIAAARILGFRTVHHGPGTNLRQELLDLQQ